MTIPVLEAPSSPLIPIATLRASDGVPEGVTGADIRVRVRRSLAGPSMLTVEVRRGRLGDREVWAQVAYWSWSVTRQRLVSAYPAYPEFGARWTLAYAQREWNARRHLPIGKIAAAVVAGIRGLAQGAPAREPEEVTS